MAFVSFQLENFDFVTKVEEAGGAGGCRCIEIYFSITWQTTVLRQQRGC